MRKGFVIGMILYAVIFLALLSVGLVFFWNFMDAFEQSRPVNTVKAYVAELTKEDMCENSEELLAGLDENIRSREESCQFIMNSVTEEITYAKKSSASTETQQVYVLRSGKQVIGSFTISAGETDKFGFQNWTVTEENFDFSYLMGQPVSITVPSEFTVSINGQVLDESYIVESGIAYDAVEEFYGDYTLPTKVTYAVDGFLGDLALEVTDAAGNPVEITEETDLNQFLPACSSQKVSELDTFVNGFLKRYVIFTGSANDAASINYVRLKEYLIEGSDLAQRLYSAIDGLNFAQSHGDTIQEVIINRYMDMGGDRYFCDVTYIVQTIGTKGAVNTTNNLKLIILNTEDGLKIEAMTRYS